MHICCANCALYPLEHFASKGIDVKGLWYNPNIHPAGEYQKRLEALRTLEGLRGLDVEYMDSYGLMDFLRETRGKESEGLRCAVCYEMRLSSAAQTARKMGLDGFTTSLLASPRQKFDLIVDIGRRMEKKYSIYFHEEDMRQGWGRGVEASKGLGLYRQKYCGCIYSEMERFARGGFRET